MQTYTAYLKGCPMMSICCICVLKINRNFWGVLGHDRLQYLVLSWRKPEDVYVKRSSYHTIDHWQHYVRVSLSLSLFLSPSLSLSLSLSFFQCLSHYLRATPCVCVFFFFFFSEACLEGTVPSESPDPQARARMPSEMIGKLLGLLIVGLD